MQLPAPPSLHDVFDPDTFQTMADALGADVMKDVVARFDAEIGNRLSSLDQPAKDLSAHAHDLLNAAGMMGFTGLSAACRLLHDTVRRGEDHSAPLESLAVMRDRTRALIAGLLERA